MKHLLMIGTAIAVLSSPALAAPARCRGAGGKFVACPTAATPATGGVTRDASGRCRVNGKFARCPAAH